MSQPHAHTHLIGGGLFDLNKPDPNLIDLEHNVPLALSHLARFHGQSNQPYTVAQHCVLGACAIYQETHEHRLALHFLLHDAHEAFIGDMTRPTQQAIAYAMACTQAHSKSPDPAFQQTTIVDLRDGINYLKRNLDRAIYLRAGLPMPTQMEHDQIADMDARLLRWERDNIFKSSASWGEEVDTARSVMLDGHLKGTIWTQNRALHEWQRTYHDLLGKVIASQRFE